MANEVTKLPQNQLVANNWTAEQMKLITDTVARNASSDELNLFLYRCKNMGLDPLKPGQIHFIKYGNTPGTIVVGIEGFRSIAGRSKKHVGTKRGVTRDDKGAAVGGWAEVYRSDWKEPARLEVSLREYNTGKGPWSKMPESMIQKVAEAGALRMAFPDDLGGVYESSEMDQADRGNVYPEQPQEGDGVQKAGAAPYRIPFGKYAKRGLEEIAIDDLRSYIIYIEEKAEKENKPIVGQVLDFVERASAYIAAFENGEAVDFGNGPGAEG